MNMSRRAREQRRTARLLLGLVVAVLALGGSGLWYLTAQDSKLPLVTVYKSPTCGCCRAWIQHLEAHGFRVRVGPKAEWDSVRARYRVPTSLQACHTAVINGLLIEGHVPAEDVRRALTSGDGARHDGLAGLILPGMPAGSPGMESAHPESYTVLALDRSGNTHPFAQHQQ